MPRGNGGIVGPVNTSFSGVWSLTEAQLRRSANTWPNFYSSLLSESATGSDAFAAADNADPYFEYTTLLLPGNGTNGATNNSFLDSSGSGVGNPTRSGNTTQGTFSPFSQTGWGNYFSANTSELSFASNAAFNLSGVSWTIEFWTYPTENAPARDRNWITRRQASGGFTSSYQIYCGSGANTLKFLVTGQTVVTSTSSLTPNQWNHVAVVWNGTTLYFFINGVQDATTGTYGAGSGGDAEPLRIGRLATNDNVLSYMSNVRVVKGVAVYTGNFTVPSTPLAITQSSGTNISAITGTQTSLLTCQSNRFVDVTANAFVPTVGTGTSVQAFSPFNPTASWSAATNGGSGYFDGTGDYLTLNDNAGGALDLGSGQFSVEFWWYPNSAAAGQYPLIGDSTGNWYIIWDNNAGTNAISLGRRGQANDVNTTGFTLTTGNWQQVVVTRQSTGTNDTRIFVNGVLRGIGTSSQNYTITTTLGIGGTSTGTNVINGYLSSLRIVKGSVPSEYQTSNTTTGTQIFSPPTTPPTAVSGTSLLLNFTNAGIHDATSKNDLETVGNAQISTTQSKWGGSSIYVDGTSDRLFNGISSPLLNLSSGDWTIESWVYFNAVGAYAYVLNIATAPANPSGLVFGINNSSRIYIGNGAVLGTNGNTTLSTGEWYYLAAVKSGSNVTLYVNGTADVTPFAFTPNSGTYLYVGADASAGNQLNAYLQDVRITRYARPITASPTAAFPTL
jgi:hypothetical protein